MTAWVYVLSCRLAPGPLWLGIYLFLWWFLFFIFVLFLLHWGYELPCQDKLPEFHSTSFLGCIRVLWFVFHPLGLGLDKVLCGWNSVTSLSYQTYYDVLINACVRYDKTKKANIGNRRNVYNTNIYSTFIDYPTDVIDHVPDSFHGGIDLPPDEF